MNNLNLRVHQLRDSQIFSEINQFIDFRIDDLLIRSGQCESDVSPLVNVIGADFGHRGVEVVP